MNKHIRYVAIMLLGTWILSSHAQDNTSTTFSGGSSTNLGTSLIIGSTGTNNTLLVNNGTVVSNTYGIIGDASTANSNSGLITGSGSTWYNYDSGLGGFNLLVGNNGSFNSLVISNGAKVNNGGFHSVIGLNAPAAGNSAIVTGAGSIWSNMITISVGYGGPSNRLTVANGGQVDVTANVNFGYAFSGSDSSILVDGANSLLNIHNQLLVGEGGGRSNNLVVQNGGKMLTTSFGRIGIHAISMENQVLITGSGSSWTNGSQSIVIGESGYNNSLIVSNGGTVYTDNSGSGLNYIGQNASGSNNYVLVTGSGSRFVNRFGLHVGHDGSSNALFVANGGTVLLGDFVGAYGLKIGANVGSANNLVQVDGGNLIATNDVAANNFIDVRRGTLRFNSGNIITERLYATNGASSVVQFNGGTFVTEGTTVSNGSAFVVGDGVSVAKLRLNGGTHSFADGLTINTVARLEGNGTVQGNTSVDGTLAPGNSPGLLTFNGNLSLSSNATYEVQLNGTTPGTLYDQVIVNGGVSLSNALLSLSVGFSPVAGDQFTIISNDLADAVSGIFNGLAEGSSVFVGPDKFSISYLGGDGNDVVLTFLMPEPTSAVLLTLGLGVILRMRRR